MTEKLPMPSAEEMQAIFDRFCGHRTNAYPRKGPSIMGPNDTLYIHGQSNDPDRFPSFCVQIKEPK